MRRRRPHRFAGPYRLSESELVRSGDGLGPFLRCNLLGDADGGRRRSRPSAFGGAFRAGWTSRNNLVTSSSRLSSSALLSSNSCCLCDGLLPLLGSPERLHLLHRQGHPPLRARSPRWTSRSSSAWTRLRSLPALSACNVASMFCSSVLPVPASAAAPAACRRASTSRRAARPKCPGPARERNRLERNRHLQEVLRDLPLSQLPSKARSLRGHFDLLEALNRASSSSESHDALAERLLFALSGPRFGGGLRARFGLLRDQTARSEQHLGVEAFELGLLLSASRTSPSLRPPFD